MIRRFLIIFLIFLLALLLIFNLFSFFLYKNFNEYLSLINSVFIIILILLSISIIRSYNILLKKIVNNSSIKINKMAKKYHHYEVLINDLLAKMAVLKDFFNKMDLSNLKKYEESISLDLDSVTDFGIKEKNFSDKKKLYSQIMNAFDDEKIKNFNNLLNISLTIMRIYHKIPYYQKLLYHSVHKTEEAAMTLIEKFETLSSEFYKTKNDCFDNLNKLKKGIKGKTFEDVINEAKNAIQKYKDLIDDLMELNKKNGDKMDKIGEWVLKVNSIIKDISDISERSKLISINSAIEAAGLGEKGKGFRILSNEIRELNKKTDSLTNEINNIMNEFNEFTKKMLEEWEVESSQMIKNIEHTSEHAQEIMNMLINSYSMVSDSFEKSTNSTERVEESLNKALISLQFQDITRQQIESVINLLKSVQDEINEYKPFFSYFGINLDSNMEIKDKIKDETIVNAKHFDIDVIKKEFEEV